jgi:hypothetical protein
MIEEIIKEKTSADHLLYVSLKYTKTGDIIQNLIFRWRVMIDECFTSMLERAKKRKIIKSIPSIPKLRIDLIQSIFSKEEAVAKILELYDFFKRIDVLEKFSENEFRKNVTLKVIYRGQMIDINIDKLKEYNAAVEKFISYVKQFLSA